MKKLPLLALFALSVVAGAAAQEPAPPPFKVIVNPAVPGTKIPRDTLAQIYLGKARSWGDGRAIVAVDLSTVSPVRRAFSESVIGMPVDGVKRHWMRNVAAGKLPPVVKETDAAVIQFVASSAGGVGYVSSAAELPDSVRLVTIQ